MRDVRALVAISTLLSFSSARAVAGELSGTKLDFSVPDIPAFTALGVSPTKVSRPANVRDLSAAIGSGFTTDGKVQSGLALEVSPVKLFGVTGEKLDDPTKSDPVTSYLGGLRFSVATNSIAAGADTKTQVATGFRYSLFSYQPENDVYLRRCILGFTFAGDLPTTIPANGELPKVSPSDFRRENDQYAEKCRTAFRSLHLATTAVEIAGFRGWQSINDNRLKALSPFTDSAWLSVSKGFNSRSPDEAGVPLTADGEKAKERAAWVAFIDGAKWKQAVAFEPTLFVRVDSVKLDGDAGRQSDLFLAGRLPLYADGWSVFLEGGYKKRNLGKAVAPPASNEDSIPVGIGGDVRLADGAWLGLFAGGDAKSGAIFSLGNLKWAVGDKRPY